MKKILGILSAALLVGTMTGCKASKLSVDLTADGEGLILTAENAKADSACTSSITVNEGDLVTVSSELTKGAVKIRVTHATEETPSDSDEAAVEWEFDGPSSIDYTLEPGEYNVSFTVTSEGATGNITVTKQAGAAPVAESGEGDGQNPIMNFVGTYAKDRASILVEADGMQESKFTIMWGSSAAETSEWTMSGVLNTETLTVDYTNGVRKNLVFNEDGSVASEEIVYENGKGSFKFDGTNKLVWTDEQEHAADDMIFEYAN
ncbi:MAG: hypothetical protein IKF60_02665 [Solobacterium sp.]|nr:hypothetical protein [Solobacterium sp.]